MTTTIKLFGLLILFAFAVASCNKDCDKMKDMCKVDECTLCKDKRFEGKKSYIFDELGNKFAWDQFNTDNQGKFLLDANGNKMYCNKDANGAYYTNASGTNIYFKDLDWADKGKWTDKKIEKYILSPLVTEDECGYIVKGKIKYLVDGETAAIIDYGDGEIDAWAVKTIYFNKDGQCGKGKGMGKGKGKEFTKCCKFEQKCKTDLSVSKIEAKADKQAAAGTLNH